jgi:hypothetical protein
MTPPATPIAQCWAMYPRPSRFGWLNRVLVSPNGRRYHLGHNGSRLARNSDAKRLGRRNPAVMAWVAATMAEPRPGARGNAMSTRPATAADAA